MSGQAKRQLRVGKHHLARIFGLNTTRLRCVGRSLTTLERPTSEPVPEVVGKATK